MFCYVGNAGEITGCVHEPVAEISHRNCLHKNTFDFIGPTDRYCAALNLLNDFVFYHCLVIVFLTLSVFWLPPESSEKFMLSGVTSIMICILLMMISSNVPVMSDRIPLIGKCV